MREVGAAREVAARLRAALAEPIRLEGMSFDIEASVGIALYPDDATGFELLMQHADVAMYLAKERRSGVERYVADSDRNSPARLALLGDLRRGMDRGELELHFQPKVILESGRTAGMEALVRWQHPVRGLMAPEEFIPLVEQSYLMRDLTSQVVDRSLAQAAAWRQDGLPVQVSLNVAARDLLDAGLAETIGRGLERYDLPPDALLLEINERVLTSEPAYAVTAVEALAALGVALSLDDFGTGYSSLVRLKRLPVSEVKIDSSFIGTAPAFPGRRGDRAVHRGPGPGARHRLGGRGRGVGGGGERAADHGLQGRAGLALQQAAQPGVGHRLADRARRDGPPPRPAAVRDRCRRPARRPGPAVRHRADRLPGAAARRPDAARRAGAARPGSAPGPALSRPAARPPGPATSRVAVRPAGPAVGWTPSSAGSPSARPAPSSAGSPSARPAPSSAGSPSARPAPSSAGSTSPARPADRSAARPPGAQPAPGMPSLWWQAVNGFGPPLRGR